jgi:hypothetical protein
LSSLSPGAAIGPSAFAQSGLTEVHFPANLQRIGQSAFHCCSALLRIDLSSVSPDVEIGPDAFAESGLTEIPFPANLRRIGKRAFRSCSALLRIDLSSVSPTRKFNAVRSRSLV